MTFLISYVLALGVFSQPSEWDCRELQDESFSGLDVIASELPGERVDVSKYFGLQILDHSIPIPAVEYTEVLFIADGDGITTLGINSESAGVAVFLSIVDLPLPHIGELSTHDQWLDYAYSIDRSLLNCEDFNPEMVLPTVALLFKGLLEGDMCELTSAHRLDWGWLFLGDGSSCPGIRGSIWKLRFRLKDGRFFVVRTTIRGDHDDPGPRYLLNNPSGELPAPPMAIEQVVQCVIEDDAACLRSVEGIDVKDSSWEPEKLKEILDILKSNKSLKRTP